MTMENNLTQTMENTTLTNTQPVQPAQLLELPNNYGATLAPDVKKQVYELAERINIRDRDFVTNYGTEQQVKLGKFADLMLTGHSTQEFGETGDLVENAMKQIKGYEVNINCFDKEDEGEKKGFLSRLLSGRTPKKTLEQKVQELRDSYATADEKIQIIVKQLSDKKRQVSKVYDDFDTLFDSNKEAYEYLTVIIYAGELGVQKANEQLAIMQQEPTIDPMDIRDLADDIERFNARLYDLKMTRSIAMTLAPQIRSLQKAAQQTEDSIQKTITLAIPMWKTNMAMALGIQTVKQGLDASNMVNDVTNQMFVAISQAGRDLTVEAAKASQRGILDIETVRTVNQNLITALTESMEVTRQGIEIRQQNEQELRELEITLKKAITSVK